MADLFNEKAKDWDKNEMVKRLSSAIGSEILKKIPFHEKMNVMDFGAGTGLITYQIAPRVNKVVAVDISEAMLTKLIEKAKSEPDTKEKVEMCCQNIIDKPLNERFDLIMSAMALHHVKNTEQLIQTFSEHLNKGAMLALADLDKEDGSFHPQDIKGVFHHGFDRHELKTILLQKGFEQIHFSTAHTINKENHEYPVFLLTAVKA